jgi:hypothetical protein
VQSESVRSAALIAMPDSMGAEIATARPRRMSERPDEPLSSLFLECGDTTGVAHAKMSNGKGEVVLERVAGRIRNRKS